MAEFASKGVAGTGLGLGAAALGVSALNGGIANLFGGWNSGHCNHVPTVNRYEMELQQKIAALESGIALRDANIYNDGKMLELYKYVDGKIEGINAKLCEQAVFNATTTATVSCIAGQVNSLLALTKLVVPNSSVCPGWGNVTVSPATAATTA